MIIRQQAETDDSDKYNNTVFLFIYTSMWTRAKHGLEFCHTQGREYCDLSSVI